MNPILSDILERLISLSHELGREDRDFAILGEGNTSAALDDGSFLVKASGSCLGTIDAGGFTRVHLDPILAAVEQPDLSDEEVRKVLEDSRVDANDRLPSVETFLHALCLSMGGAKWVGHTHAISVLRILCSQFGAEPFLHHIFPDAIVVCGRHLAVVPYVDPGIRLAVEVRDSLRAFIDQHGAPPKIILMENHGPVILGQSDRDVLHTMLMLDKWAKIIAGTYVLGGPQYLDSSLSDRIENRPDEHYRRKAIGAL
ncbi:MAG TPA: class II aldolase/adducin family protein [Chthoniobacterales bacterium]|jgi:rhamnose utilization protein RhaD (predicted bifunctional aldolase and dehydrogenase)|nr:class II aldolase/adducin family protein [Chthoniobacterales bacterium]